MITDVPMNPRDLDLFLVGFRNSIDEEDIHANPFFYLAKPTEENLLKYRLDRPDNRMKLLSEVIFFVPLILFKILLSVILSVTYFERADKRKSPNQFKAKYFFLCHFTYSQDPNKDDTFYGKNLMNCDSFAFYLNHTRIRLDKILDKFHKAGKENVAINPKSLNPIKTVWVQICQSRVSFILLRRALLDRKLKIEQRRLIIRAAVFQHSRPTMANLVLKQRFLELYRQVDSDYVVLTIEGHAHEALIIRTCHQRLKNVVVVGYQHAPVVPAQFNLFANVSLLRSHDFFLTSGQTVKNVAIEKNFKCNIDILGSPKSRDYTYQTKSSTKPQILIAPEATENSFTFFINLMNEIAPLLPKFLFVLRAHPSLGNLAQRITKYELVNLSNVMVSNSPLEVDLKNSHFVVFRSSSVAIEGLAFGAYPIHIDFNGSNELNPITNNFINRTALNSVAQVVNFVNQFDLKLLQNEAYQRSLFEQFHKYFNPLQNITHVVH
jgi:hypothetical protein